MPQREADLFEKFAAWFRKQLEASREELGVVPKLPLPPDLTARGIPPALLGIRPKDAQRLRAFHAGFTRELPVGPVATYGAIDPMKPDEIMLNPILTEREQERLYRSGFLQQPPWDENKARAEMFHTLLHEFGHKRAGHISPNVIRAVYETILYGGEYNPRLEAEAEENAAELAPKFTYLRPDLREEIKAIASATAKLHRKRQERKDPLTEMRDTLSRFFGLR